MMIKYFKTIQSIFLVAVLFFAASGFFIHAKSQKANKKKLGVYEYQEIFSTVYSLIQSNYVKDVSEEELMLGAINGMISVLKDPHSHFLNKNQLRELSINTSGNFGGIGIEVSILDKQLVIVSPVINSPAMQAGLLPGDIIVKINTKFVKKIGFKNAFKLLRGEVGEGIRLYIKRKNTDETLVFYIIRANIKLEIVSSTLIPNTKIAYIKLKQFSRSAIHDMQTTLRNFKNKNVKALILDLRWNPGGLLKGAKTIADLFLSAGKKIVSTRGRRKANNTTFFSTDTSTIFPDLPMIVLINGGSASSSEIVAGALQDNKRAKILGQKSFGKASVQYIYSLPFNSALALTIQRYYTPSGKLIHRKGIIPDIIVKPEVFLARERNAIKKLKQLNLLHKFIKKYKKYTLMTSNIWLGKLRKAGIILSSKTAKLILKSELNSLNLKKHSIVDMEFDSQLRKAVSLLNE